MYEYDRVEIRVFENAYLEGVHLPLRPPILRRKQKGIFKDTVVLIAPLTTLDHRSQYGTSETHSRQPHRIKRGQVQGAVQGARRETQGGGLNQ